MGFGVLQEVMIEMQRISVVLQFMVVTNNQNRSNLKPYSSHCSDYLFKQEGGFRHAISAWEIIQIVHKANFL